MGSLIGHAVYELLSMLFNTLAICWIDSNTSTHTERQTDDEIDPEDGGEWSGRISSTVICLTARLDRARGWPEGNILIMGIVHPDHAAYTRTFCQLSATTQEDTSNT